MRSPTRLFGGTAEYVALWLKDAELERVFYWYVTAMIGVSLIVYLADARHQARKPHPGGLITVIASGAKQSSADLRAPWIASSLSLSQ